ncbi:MAG: FG-GAP-like repeat-containing protein [Anaerolineaceae bacterium]
MFRKIALQVGLLAIVLVLLSACQSKPATTPAPSSTPTISSTPLPSSTPAPTPTIAVLFTLVDSSQYFGQGNGVSAVVGDVEGDGDNDALVSYSDVASLLLINDGAGNFTVSDQVFNPSTNAALGDLNGDKSLDIFFTGENFNQVWLNDGKGHFTKTQEWKTFESSSVALGDLDGDGDLDAYITNWNNRPDQVFLNDGNGNFSDSGQKLGNWFGCDVALGDVDQDGDLDAMVANNGEASDNATVLWFNDGKGNFKESGQRLGFTNAYSVALGDLDNDGDLDAFIANSGHMGANPVDKVWLNDGEGVFADSGQSLGYFYSLTVSLGDLDNDGDLDAITGSWNSGPRIWINDGKGNFYDAKMELNSPNNTGVALADMDGDGDLDLFVSTNTWTGGDGRAKLWMNQLIP